MNEFRLQHIRAYMCPSTHLKHYMSIQNHCRIAQQSATNHALLSRIRICIRSRSSAGTPLIPKTPGGIFDIAVLPPLPLPGAEDIFL